MKIGIVIHSWWMRWRGKYSSSKYPAFLDALEVMNYTHQLGAAGLQIMVDKWEDDFSEKMRALREKLGLYLEGSITLPKEEADVPYFTTTLQRAKHAGASVFRSAVGGRRYELYQRHEDFLAFKSQALRSMQLAAPVAEKHGVRIGIENHKDFHAGELARLLQEVSSESIGACIDTGNNIALLEEPMSVVETLAPFAVTTHLKDMAVQPSAEGFKLAEVPLGEGMLDLQAMVDTIRAANPEVTINLEMITRDPLTIPCLSQDYWHTFPEKPAVELAMALASVQHFAAPKLATLTDMELESSLRMEDENIRSSLRFAESLLQA